MTARDTNDPEVEPVKLQLIINPMAATVSTKRAALVQRTLRRGHELSVSRTLDRGHAITLARGAARAGCQVVVVFGGDGTCNEGATGLAGTETALAVLPGGSTNVVARTMGSARKLVPALQQLRVALDRPPRRIGLGLVNDRYFLCNLGMGFDAAVVHEVEKRPQLKRSIGQGAFVYAAIATWFGGFDHSRPHLIVREGDATVLEDGYFAICQNTNPYTYLGPKPFNVAPDAGLDTALALTTIRTLRLRTFLPLVASALGDGHKLRRHPQVDYRPDVRSITVDGHRRFPYQVDGDYLGEAERLTITYEPDRLLLVTPAL